MDTPESKETEQNRAEVSVVIPTFNSQHFIDETISRIVTVLKSCSSNFEVIVVDDGSSDNTWQQLLSLASTNDRLIAISLVQNSGQHSALLCGIRYASGQRIVTIDDDLQNPPDEIPRMLTYFDENSLDLLIGRIHEARKARTRQIGSALVNRIVNWIFNKPSDLYLSPFRVMSQQVASQVKLTRHNTPYITGELLLASKRVANLDVRHDRRIYGTSTYSPLRIMKLLRRIVFSYSVKLLRICSLAGFVLALIALVISGLLGIRGLMVHGTFPGWTSIVMAISFFSSVVILLLSMIGEYLAVLMAQALGEPPYVVDRVVGTNRERQD